MRVSLIPSARHKKYNIFYTELTFTDHEMKVGDLSVGGIIGIIIAIVTLGIIAGLGFIIVILKSQT